MKGKAKRYLRSLAVNIEPIFQIGKGVLNENLLKQLDDALEARELIKVRVLNNCEENAKELAPQIADSLGAVLVQTIGHNMVFYRKSLEKPKIELPE
ncbi:MAG: ribosome assembly RNA-binding protein YhbY [Clostridia bacterium]|jgi:RNA-binding protein|nr:ribosome assembly RNA-binding protein YhbY [Clostridia bacterium]